MSSQAGTPLDSYKQRAEQAQLSAEQANERRGKWLAASVVLGLITAVLLYESFLAKKLPYWSFIPSLVVLSVAMKQAADHRSRVLKFVSVREYCDKGIARLKHDWDVLDDGKHFEANKLRVVGGVSDAGKTVGRLSPAKLV